MQDWLPEEEIDAIFKRYDADKNGVIRWAAGGAAGQRDWRGEECSVLRHARGMLTAALCQ